jgi:hypothetical protein
MLQPLHPVELVGEFLGADRIAVRQVNAAYGQGALGGLHAALDVTRLDIGVAARQGTLGDLDGRARDQGHAVEAFLSHYFDPIPRSLDGGAGKLLFLGLQLLQYQHIGLQAIEQGYEVSRPLADGIDVPGRDLHRAEITR